MFTCDPAFDPNGPRRNEVQSWCDANKIRRDQIYNEKSASKYCKESRDQVVEFERRNRKVLTGARVLHDLGGAFKKDPKFILDERSEKVIPFPTEQHGELSVLDNKLNAVAKTKWRQERHNADFSWDAFLLFVELHRVDQESISSWWTFNYLLNVPHLTLAAVEKRLKGQMDGYLFDRSSLTATISNTRIWLQDHDEVELVYEGDLVDDELDGPYWQ
ncbi:MAG: hypothetical protein V4628_15480 [Pseudomonadota bacterium]